MNRKPQLFRATTILLLGSWMFAAACAQTPFEDWAAEHGVLGYSVAAAPEQGFSTTWVGGLRDVERNLPVEPQTVFRVASISKATVALGFFKLWANGQVDLDQDVNEFLQTTPTGPLQHPEFPGVAITPRMLLSHTSGLRDGAGYSPCLLYTSDAADE